ncbi:MAG: glycosyltransferase [Desulfobacterales bacterium]|nr:glycosyltransferase [Desulfobacterales bacterium]
MKYSIIVLLEREEIHKGSVQFIRDLHDLFLNRQEPFEILIIANGLGPFLRHELDELLVRNNRIKAIQFDTKTTQAVCLKTAIGGSNGKIIVVCGSYQQIPDDSLIKFLDSLDSETDIVAPWRQHRVDTPFNQLESKLFNALVRTLTATDFHDLSCTVKIFRREVVEETDIYGNMYRFLPILAERRGFKVKEIKCEHYQQFGIGKSGFYSLSHYFTTFIDILTLYFNTRFSRKPLRFFSAIGLIFLLAGLIITAYVFAEKFLMGYPVGGRPLLLLAILFMVLGVQAASVGLLGEIIAFTHGRNKKEYTIEKTI